MQINTEPISSNYLLYGVSPLVEALCPCFNIIPGPSTKQLAAISRPQNLLKLFKTANSKPSSHASHIPFHENHNKGFCPSASQHAISSQGSVSVNFLLHDHHFHVCMSYLMMKTSPRYPLTHQDSCLSLNPHNSWVKARELKEVTLLSLLDPLT